MEIGNDSRRGWSEERGISTSTPNFTTSAACRNDRRHFGRLAVLRREDDALKFATALASKQDLKMSAATYVECGIVATGTAIR